MKLIPNKFPGNMQDAVDCPEWVVPFHLFKLLAEEVDLCLLFLIVNKLISIFF
jgi:hypothetical protein